MLLISVNAASIDLQISAENVDGTPKTNVISASVRVYHISSGSEIDDLSSVTMNSVPSAPNIFRYTWTAPSLNEGQYFVEYRLADADNLNFLGMEDLVIHNSASATDLEFLKQVASGKWEILNSQMIYYDTSGSEILRFNLYDINGALTNGINMFKREPT